MKKTLVIGAILLAFITVLGIAGVVYAQTQTPPTQPPGFGSGFGPGFGRGMMGSGTGMGPGMMSTGTMGPGMMGRGGFGPMHTYTLEAFASLVGLTVDEVNDRLSNGETMWEIARAEGFSDTEIQDLMAQAHNTALDKAVADGVITQEQADWMRERMSQGMGGGLGTGSCHGGGGMMGGRRWNQPAPDA